MKSLRWFWFSLTLSALLAVAAVAAGPQGILARKSAADYPVHGWLGAVAVGARLLTAKQVRAKFVTEVSRCCLVVEVGLFPSSGQAAEVAPSDFILTSLTTRASFMPEDPKVVAYAVSKSQASDTEVSIYPSVGVGYGTGGGGPWGYPGYPGYPIPGGVYTTVGVGVGVGKAAPPSSADTATMQTELTEKGLPEGSFTKPVAGYLYFRVPSDNGPYELHYRVGEKTLSLRLP
jgi:hypothetical protein